MKRAAALPVFAAFVAVALMPVGAQETGVFADGRWEGEADFGEGPEPIVLRLFTADAESGGTSGGLIDLPARRLFGYPIDRVLRDFAGIRFGLLDGAPIGSAIELRVSSSASPEGELYRVKGVARLLREGVEREARATSAGPFRWPIRAPSRADRTSA